MAITIDDLTVNFDHLDQTKVLEHWRWLIGPSKYPILLTAVGDAFLKDANDGSVHFLQVGSAEVRPIASDMEEFRTLLADKDFVLDYFAVEAVMALEQAGIKLGHGQIYSLKVPAVLGGKYSLDNVNPTDILIHFSLTGQIHEQVKDLPPGTKITGFTIQE
jgi:hypothetical protein